MEIKKTPCHNAEYIYVEFTAENLKTIVVCSECWQSGKMFLVTIINYKE